MRHKNYNLIAQWHGPLGDNSEFRGELIMLDINAFEFIVAFRYGREAHQYILDLNCSKDEALEICNDMVAPLTENLEDDEEEESLAPPPFRGALAFL